MHLMPPLRQLDAQLRAHYAAAAVGGIASDADFHLFLSLRSTPLQGLPLSIILLLLLHAARRPLGLAARFRHNFLSLRSTPLQGLPLAIILLPLLHAARRPLGLAARFRHNFLSLRSTPLQGLPLAIILLPLLHSGAPFAPD